MSCFVFSVVVVRSHLPAMKRSWIDGFRTSIRTYNEYYRICTFKLSTILSAANKDNNDLVFQNKHVKYKNQKEHITGHCLQQCGQL